MTLAAGTRFGSFEILAPLGAGGMGEVYRARDTRLGREVAIKVLPEEFASDPERLRRFETEARAAAALNHPNILVLHDIGTYDGVPYIVTELLEGESLRQRLRVGPVPPEKAVDMGVQIAQGLAAAHERGIVHRDLKPENLFVTKDGRIKILDFGLARLRPEGSGEQIQSEDPTAESPTHEGKILGTPGYMSPEQVRGFVAGPRTDIFAFGCVLYEMLSGKRAFGGATRTDIAAAILRDDPDSLPTLISPALDRIVRRCLEKRPEDRFSSAHDLAIAVSEASRLAPPGAPQGGRVLLWLKNRPLLPMAIGVTFILAVVFWSFVRHSPSAPLEGVAPSIAVLPLANLSDDKEQEYFSDGLSEELMNLLTKVKGLHVAGHTSSFAFKGKKADVADIGRQLHVATVLEGNVRRSGDRLRVSVRLVNVANGYQMWAETYDRAMTEVFSLQDEIAGAVVAALKMKLLPQEHATVSQHRTANPEAYTQYLLGRHFYNLNSTEGWKKAVEAYQNAIRLDPSYAAAYAGMSFAEIFLAGFSANVTEEAVREQKARVAAEKAILFDPSLADGYGARGMVRFHTFPPDWPGARADLEQALALDPGNPDLHVDLSGFLSRIGLFSESIAEVRKAIDLDPLSAAAWQSLGWYLCLTGDLPGSRKAMIRAIEINPDDIISHYQLGVTSLLEGNPKASLVEFAQTLEYFRLVGVAMAEHDLGHEKESQQALDELISKLTDSCAFQVAEVYAWRGEKDKAFEWLDRAYAQGDLGMVSLKSDPLLTRLYSDPRYAEQVRRMKCPGGTNP